MKINAKCSRIKMHPAALALAFGYLTLVPTVNADTTNAAPPGPSVTGRKANENFFRRFKESTEEALATPSNPPPDTNAPPSKRRGLPAPFDAPPYPNGEWQIGGTETIGDQNLTPDYPFMQALYDGPHGQFWRDNKIKFYGWEDFSGDFGSSHATGLDRFGEQANYPEAYDQRPQTFNQNQFVIYAERTPDEAQTDHIDWGFRMSWIYGLDYRYMISRGWDSRQLLVDDKFNGMDDPMMYFNLYIPNIAQGLNLTLGRIISEADIEAQLAPNNLMSSHSLLYTYDPYCQWGLFGTLKLNQNWVVQYGISAGNDVTPWETQDAGTQPTSSIMVQWQSSNGKWGFYGGDNALNNGTWGFNNIQQEVGTITYKFNDQIWTSHETWYMFQQHCPGQFNWNGTPYTTPLPAGTPYTDGQIPVHPGYANEWATLNYTMFRLAPNTFFTVRNELFDDCDGQRTGFATLYEEHSVGLTWWPCSIVTVRPELRYERALGCHGRANNLSSLSPNYVDEMRPYDNGSRQQQITFSCDCIVHF
jgi:Putative beta-barrel porin-2, OmpL-like. bbp2